MQWGWYNGDNQKWYIVDCGDGWYKFAAKHSGQALDVADNGSANGTKIQQYLDNGSSVQRFRILCQSGHSYGAWKVTKAATTTSTGTKTRTCSICKNVETVVIPKLTASNPITAITLNNSSLNLIRRKKPNPLCNH